PRRAGSRSSRSRGRPPRRSRRRSPGPPPPQRRPRSRCAGRAAACRGRPPRPDRSPPPSGRRACALVAASELPRLAEVVVVVDLAPVDRADRGRADRAAAVHELLEAVLVIELGIALPGGLERLRQTLRRRGLDQREPDVLTTTLSHRHLLRDPAHEA